MMQEIKVKTRNGVTRTRYRPTWAEVDLGAIEYNYKRVKGIVGKEIKVMVVVKANAYGHGTVEVSGVLEKLGVDYLGVATTDEAIRLRDHGIKTPVLILGSVLPNEVRAAVENDVTLTLCSYELLEEIKRVTSPPWQERKAGQGNQKPSFDYAQDGSASGSEAKPETSHKPDSKLREVPRSEIKAKVHIKIDTGMGRIGVWHEEALSFIKNLVGEKRISIEGIYTHFSSAGRDDFFTNYQIESFEKLLSQLEGLGIRIPLKHAANSIATVDFKRSHLNLVRPGLIIYGMHPKHTFPKLIKLKPTMSLKTRVVYIKDTPPGRSISYGRTFITQKHTKIATLPIGYADGYGRNLSNKAEVLVKGHRAPVVGRVTMDQAMIDVGHIKGVRVGDEVVLIGRQGREEIRTEKLARLAGTIAYEVVCSISNRVPRLYKY